MKQILLTTTLLFLLHATAFGMTDEKVVTAATDGVAQLTLKEDKYPLHKAAWQGNSAKCQRLLEAKAPVDEQDKNKNTPLHLAAHRNHPNICKLLIDVGKANIEAKDADGHTPLRAAYENNSHEALTVLIERRANTKTLNELRKLTIIVSPLVAEEECPGANGTTAVLKFYRVKFVQVFSYDQLPVKTKMYVSSDVFNKKEYERRCPPKSHDDYITREETRVYQGASIDIKAMLEELGCVKDAEKIADKAAAALARFAKESVDQKR